MSEIKKYSNIDSNRIINESLNRKTRGKVYVFCNNLINNEKNVDIKEGLINLRDLFYGPKGHFRGFYEKIFEEYIEREFKEKGIDFDKDDLNPIEDKFLTKKFVKEEFEEFVNKIIKLEGTNKSANNFINGLKALDKYRNETITVDGKRYTLWEVAIDTLLVDMNKFGAEDRNKFINKLKLNKLLEEITKEK